MAEVDIFESAYKISGHCKQRYAERIMDKDNTNDINRFIAENEEKIKTDINKMITYGQLIYEGRQSQKDGKGNVLNVYLKDCWVVLVDNSNNVVVTLYKIDLGLGDEFNKLYVRKMLDKLQDSQVRLADTKVLLDKETETYKSMINDNEAQINEYKSMIKNLEKLNASYKTIIENNSVRVHQAKRDVADVVNQLVGKKEF